MDLNQIGPTLKSISATAGGVGVLVYSAARIVSHLTKPYTWLGKACAWILGHIPVPGELPTQQK